MNRVYTFLLAAVCVFGTLSPLVAMTALEPISEKSEKLFFRGSVTDGCLSTSVDIHASETVTNGVSEQRLLVVTNSWDNCNSGAPLSHGEGEKLAAEIDIGTPLGEGTVNDTVDVRICQNDAVTCHMATVTVDLSFAPAPSENFLNDDHRVRGRDDGVLFREVYKSRLIQAHVVGVVTVESGVITSGSEAWASKYKLFRE